MSLPDLVCAFISVACVIGMARLALLKRAAKTRFREIDRMLSEGRLDEAGRAIEIMKDTDKVLSWKRIFDLTNWDFRGMVT